MDWVKIITQYFNSGYYMVDQVKVFVVKGKITPTDYQTITGIVYVV